MTRLVATYASTAEFLAAFDEEMQAGGLFIGSATAEGAEALADCVVEVRVATEPPLEVAARIAAVSSFGVAAMFQGSRGGAPASLAELARRLRASTAAVSMESATEPPPDEEPAREELPRGQLAERLHALTAAEKMQLALSGTREERFALIRDPNRALHSYVLRNPRTGVDEVQYLAKLPNLSPDAFKIIADHAEWGMNSVVCTALVRNPRSPISLALRLLDRVPMQEVRAIAKGGGRPALVQAARKKLGSPAK